MPVNISNAFKARTKKGHSVFRIRIDNNEFLSNLEQGNTVMAIDVLTDKYGNPSIQRGTGKNGKKYEALHYYTWSMKPTEGDQNAHVEVNQSVTATNP